MSLDGSSQSSERRYAYERETGVPMQEFASFDPHPRTPKKPLPPGSCDSQIHVFGPLDRYPQRPNAVFESPEAVFSEAQRMHVVVGIDRCVIVQVNNYGTDHSCTLDALEAGGREDYRACGIVYPETTDAELEALHEAGVRGARFNFMRGVNFVYDPNEFARTISRISELGWYAKIHPDTGRLADIKGLLDPLKIPCLMDHYGRPGAPDVNDENVRISQRLLEKGNWYMMLSNAHRFARDKASWTDVVPIMRSYIDTAPGRCVWASDWPHPLSRVPVPNDGEILDFLIDNTDEAELQAILVDNPAELFGF